MYFYILIELSKLAVCDDRENKPVRNALRKYFPDMNITRIEIGDFIDDDLDFCIERKNVLDLAGSIKDGRVFDQAINMKDNYKHVYIIQVGTYEQVRLNHYQNISINHFIGAQTDLAMLYGVPVLQCENLPQYARYVNSLFRKIDQEPPVRKERRKRKIKENKELSMLLGIRGLGEKRCRAILKQFPSIRNICEASVEDLASVKGIGNKYSREIKKVLY